MADHGMIDVSALRILDGQGDVVLEFVPYQPLAATTEPPPVADDSWDRVAAAGKMVVGTSAEVEPAASLPLLALRRGGIIIHRHCNHRRRRCIYYR